jgi:hypothetical protein
MSPILLIRGGIEITICKAGLFITLERVLDKLSNNTTPNSVLQVFTRILYERLLKILYDLHRGSSGSCHGSIDEKHVLLTRHGGVSLLENLDTEFPSNTINGKNDMMKLGILLWKVASRSKNLITVSLLTPLPMNEGFDAELQNVVEMLIFDPNESFKRLQTGATKSKNVTSTSSSSGLLSSEEIDAALAASSESSPKETNFKAIVSLPPPPSLSLSLNRVTEKQSLSRSPPSVPLSTGNFSSSPQPQHAKPLSPSQRLQTSVSQIEQSQQTTQIGQHQLSADAIISHPVKLSLRDRLRQEAADRAAKDRESELLAARIAAYAERLALQQKSKALLFEPSSRIETSSSINVVKSLARTLSTPSTNYVQSQSQSTNHVSVSEDSSLSHPLARSESPLLPIRKKGYQDSRTIEDREAEERLLTNARIAAHAERLALQQKYGARGIR